MRRLTKNRRSILMALLDAAPEGMHGADLADVTGIASGSLYPALREFRKGPLVRTEWQSEDDDQPPLRIYFLTPDGVAFAHQLEAGSISAAVDWRRFISPLISGLIS